MWSARTRVSAEQVSTSCTSRERRNASGDAAGACAKDVARAGSRSKVAAQDERVVDVATGGGYWTRRK